MTTNCRLGVVGAVLALATVATSSQVWGDADQKPQPQPILSGSRIGQDKPDRSFVEELASSKFTGKSVITYQTADGNTLFALQLKPKLEIGSPRRCDYLVIVDTSASQVGGPLVAARQIAEELAKQASPGDRIAIR